MSWYYFGRPDRSLPSGSAEFQARTIRLELDGAQLRGRRLIGRGFLRFAVSASLALPTAFACQASSMEYRTTMLTSEFVEMIGVCVHTPYTDGAYVNVGNILQDLKFLGINRVRDTLPGTNSSESLHARDVLRRMVFDEIKLDLFVSGDWKQIGALEFVRNLGKAVPGSVEYVESFNEINNFPIVYEGQTGADGAKAAQKALYAAVKADPDLKHISVVDMTGLDEVQGGSARLTSLNGYADLMNNHAYAQNGDQPATRINLASINAYKLVEGEFAKVITEFGYASMPESGWLMIGVDERTQAKGILNGLFDAARSDYAKVYIYELLDQKPDPNFKEREHHFGLFTFENRPKLAARAISSLTKILRSGDAEGASVTQKVGPNNNGSTPAKIAVQLADPAQQISTLVLEKQNGNLVAAVWREPQFWDRATGKALEAKPTQVAVSFEKQCGSTKLYDVFKSDEPSAVSIGNALSFMLLDYVQLVECVK